MRSGLYIPPKVRLDLAQWSREATPKEACGLLFGAGRKVERALRADTAVTDGLSFELPPALLLAHAGDPTWIGVWHSHPEGPPELSTLDLEGAAAWPRLLQVLVTPGGLRAFGPFAEGCPPLW